MLHRLLLWSLSFRRWWPGFPIKPPSTICMAEPALSLRGAARTFAHARINSGRSATAEGRRPKTRGTPVGHQVCSRRVNVSGLTCCSVAGTPTSAPAYPSRNLRPRAPMAQRSGLHGRIRSDPDHAPPSERQRQQIPRPRSHASCPRWRNRSHESSGRDIQITLFSNIPAHPSLFG